VNLPDEMAMSSISVGLWDSDGEAALGCNPRADHLPAAEPQWYAIQVRPSFEKKAETQLQNKGIETFLPLVRQQRRWSDRRKTIYTPLFSGYQFVRIRLSRANRLCVLQTAGVMNFVGFATGATPVAQTQVESLRRLLSGDSECSIRPFLRMGQRVRIRGGALNGIEGILKENDRDHLVLSIDCIQRSIAFRLAGYEVEAV
jgi:transcription antitermination factor NusG